jgi:hypothetical protein
MNHSASVDIWQTNLFAIINRRSYGSLDTMWRSDISLPASPKRGIHSFSYNVKDDQSLLWIAARFNEVDCWVWNGLPTLCSVSCTGKRSRCEDAPWIPMKIAKKHAALQSTRQAHEQEAEATGAALQRWRRRQFGKMKNRGVCCGCFGVWWQLWKWRLAL